jgi:osmotically inducible protein OsmC
MATRNGSATWKGNLQEGSGRLTVGEGAWEGGYSFSSRFEEGEGTNPEELIAAGHAACFSMALSHAMAEAGHEPRSVATTAKVHLRNVDGEPTIAKIELETEGEVPGIDEAEFTRFAEEAKSDCVVSRALAGVGEMELTARLAG